MMNDDKSKLASILEKVAKLLALSTSDNINEATSAAGKAAELMDKYRIEMADLPGNDKDEKVEFDSGTPIYETGRTVPWKMYLASVLTKHYGVAYYLDFRKTREMGRKYTQIRLVGKKSDVEMVRYFFAYLSSEIQRICDNTLRGKGYAHSYLFSFCYGFAVGIEKQLKASRAAIKAEGISSTALAKLDNSLQEASSWMNDNIKLTNVNASNKSRINLDAYSSGVQNGESFHLGSSLPKGSNNLLGN